MPRNLHALRRAYDASVAESVHVTPADAGLVEAGRALADKIDEAVAEGGPDSTKALYLVPHLTNNLRELLATPLVRLANGAAEVKAPKGRLADLRAVANRDAG